METYATWWQEVEKCVRRERDLAGIQWYLADRISQGFGEPIDNIKGQWIATRQITIRAGYEDQYRVVKHEMLHDLLQGDASHEHWSWGMCDERVGTPGEPFLDIGTYDYELRFTEGLSEWRFEGTLTVVAATTRRAQAVWRVNGVTGNGPAAYEPTATRGEWDYDAFVIGAKVSGSADLEIRNRIAVVNGKMRCLIALVGTRPAPCWVRNP